MALRTPLFGSNVTIVGSNITIVIKMRNDADDPIPIGTIMPIDIGAAIPDNWAPYNPINFAKVKTYINAAT